MSFSWTKISWKRLSKVFPNTILRFSQIFKFFPHFPIFTFSGQGISGNGVWENHIWEFFVRKKPVTPLSEWGTNWHTWDCVEFIITQPDYGYSCKMVRWTRSRNLLRFMSLMLWSKDEIWKPSDAIFPIKQRINAELFIDAGAELYIQKGS